MKFACFFFSLLFLSCSNTEKKEVITEQTEESEKLIAKNENVIKAELTFEETQDSLRTVLLNSKPNENLKTSILQELYIRGLVNQNNDKIEFKLPFNLHGFDCGAPDCYSTDITFEITAKEPIEFPKTINFSLFEHGCEIEKEISEDGIFELVEQSPEFVNYYSKKQQSNLVIFIKKRKLYYFPDTKPNSIKAELIDKIFDDFNEKDENAIVPYQSTIMTTNEYENFIQNE